MTRFPAELPAQSDPSIAYADEHVRLHGVRLYRQTWRPRAAPVIGVVVYTHGMHSHGIPYYCCIDRVIILLLC